MADGHLSRSLVIGCGNTLRSDDGAGVVAADRVGAAFPNLAVITCHQLTPELAVKVSQADLVVFLDASAETEPGQVSVTPLKAAAQTDAGVTHHVRPDVLLALAATLYDNAPTAYLITVGASSFVLGERLSDPVASALPRMMQAVADVLGQG